MKCPICYYKDTKVTNSRPAADGFSIRRRRECAKCGFRFSTYEEIEILDMAVIKQDGRREAYDKNKIIRGLEKSFEKRPITEEKFKKLVNLIERDIQKIKKNEISSKQIGEIITKHLKRTDQVAYIRFASVYQSFEDAQAFEDELKKLSRKNPKK